MDIEAVYRQMEDRIQAWALTRSEVRAVVVVSWRVRSQQAFDTFSDLDLLLFVDAAAAQENQPV